jgi:hypothetical protein
MIKILLQVIILFVFLIIKIDMEEYTRLELLCFIYNFLFMHVLIRYIV